MWSPSLVLLFFAPVDIYHSHVSASRPIPRSSLSVLKYGFSLLLIIIQVLLILFQLINVGYVLDEIPVGEYLAPVVRLVTYVSQYLTGISESLDEMDLDSAGEKTS